MENNTLCNRHSLGVNNHTKMYVTYTRIYGWSDYGGESSYQPGYRLENMMWMTLLVYDYIIPGEKYFTFLKKIFDSIENVQKNYNWLITGYECYPQNIKYVERLSKEWCWITGKELTKMIETENFQWIWGVFSAFPESVTKDDALKYELPKADGNEKIWKNPISIQHPLSVMEIIAWDSSMTILISKFDEIVEKLLKSNPLIEDLEEYNKN